MLRQLLVITLNINRLPGLLRQGPGLGRDLFGDAQVVKRGGSLCVIEVDVVNDAGDRIARALVTYKLSLPK